MNTDNYDLTTEEGFCKALKDLPRTTFDILFPTAVLVRIALELFAGAKEAKLREQRRAAVELIKAGRENGAKKMKIKLDQTIGVDLATTAVGEPIRVTVGDHGETYIEVEYA